MLTRRQILKLAVTAGTGLLLPAKWLSDDHKALAYSESAGLKKFVQPLRGVGPNGIPLASPDTFRAPVTGVTHYTIGINDYTDKLHPDLDPTRLRGFQPAVCLGGGLQPQRHLSGIIVARKGTPI